MVDHINFQKMAASLPNAHRVKRADQKSRQQQYQHAFKKFLSQDGDKQTESGEDQEDKKKSKHVNPAELKSTSILEPAFEDRKTIAKNYHGRRIDVHA